MLFGFGKKEEEEKQALFKTSLTDKRIWKRSRK
jgi:hypothetical protein